jgi:anti-sigma B factor antagonist
MVDVDAERRTAVRSQVRELTSHPTQSSDTETVVIVSGEVDLCTSASLRDQLLQNARTSAGDVVVDLAETSFLDCSGLAAIAAARDVLRARNHDLRVRGAHGVVARAIAVTGLTALLADSAGSAATQGCDGTVDPDRVHCGLEWNADTALDWNRPRLEQPSIGTASAGIDDSLKERARSAIFRW